MIVYDEVFYITPVAQERPRVRVMVPKGVDKKPFAIVYDPEKSKTFKKELGQLAKDTMHKWKIIEGPVRMSCKIYIKRPKSVKRVYPEVKPDLSNYIKGVEDALNGIVYTDDSKIVDYDKCCKRYTSGDEEPCIEVVLYSM